MPVPVFPIIFWSNPIASQPFPKDATRHRARFLSALVVLAMAWSAQAGNLPYWAMEYAKFDHYSVKDGLSQNSVYDIIQDDKGFIWLATQNGVNRFDGHNFLTFRPEPGNPNSVSGHTITKLLNAKDGAIWVATQGEGINRQDPHTRRFERFTHDPSRPDSLSSDQVRSVVQDQGGTIWVATENGLNRYLGKGRWEQVGHQPGGLPYHSIMSLAVDRHNRLWIGLVQGLACLSADRQRFTSWTKDTPNQSSAILGSVTAIAPYDDRVFIGTSTGLAVIDGASGQWRRIELEGNSAPLAINQLLVDSERRLWIAATNALWLYHPNSGTSTSFNEKARGEGLLDLVFQSLFQDRTGIIWIGTEATGVYKLNPYSSKIVHISKSKKPGGLPHGLILYFHVDRAGRFWIATDGGGLMRFDPATGRFFEFHRQDPQRPNRSPSNNNIWSIAEDRRGVLWMATRNGLNRFEPDTGAWRHYLHDPQKPESLAMSKSYSVLVDDQDRVWISTFGGGLDLLVDEAGVFRHYPYDPRNPKGLNSGLLLYVAQDRRKHMWVGTYGSGLNLYRPESDDFEHFQHDPENPRSLAEDTIGHMYHDSQDRLWFSTSLGFSRYHWETRDFTTYNSLKGLGDDNTYAIQEDDRGFLWISTNKGISRFDPRSERFLNLDTSHNLQSNEFNQAAAFLHKGLLYFGGVNGFNVFDPNLIDRPGHPPPVVLTALRKNNDPYQESLIVEDLEQILLEPQDRIVSLEFAALDFLAPSRNRYAYVLEGFSEEVIDLGAQHDLTFTNLDPGTYTLRIRAANADGVWNEDGLRLAVVVVPTFWQTRFAYALYALMALALIGGIWLSQRRRLRRAEQNSERLRQLDRFKDEFLARTSEELRPPLSGVIGIAESLLEGAAGTLSPMLSENLALIASNGRRLDNMVSDLLDFSAMKHQRLQLERSAVDVESVCKVVMALVEPLLERRPVALVLDLPPDLPSVLADENRLHQIFYNLLDNAAKFTQQGEIRLSARRAEGQVELSVSDTGIGIPEHQQHQIFTSYQELGSAERQISGSGLGLAVTRQLVELHGAEIQLQSTPGKGSRFSFNLPVADQNLTPATDASLLRWSERVAHLDAESSSVKDLSAFHILVVEDERVNRAVLRNLLALQGYRVSQARDGEEALALALGETRFDLILLDVLMPRITGLEVCERLREHFSLQELPIILMTAKHQAAELHIVFAKGGSDYLTKPFSKDELITRVKMHLALLDVHRNLEAIVAERTAELARQKGDLEMLDTIVQAINREQRLEELLAVALHESLRMFPQSDSGSFLLFDNKRGIFFVAACLGYPWELGRQVRMTPSQVQQRYREGSEELEKGIFIIRNPEDSTRPEAVRVLAPPKALLAMEVLIDGETLCILVLDHSTSSQGFSHEDVRRLQRFREHIISAVTRAQMLENLAQSQRDLVEAAHMFGMADNASLVLHNMGNKLNSVNISVQMMRERMERAQWVGIAQRTRDMLHADLDLPWLHQNPQAVKFLELFRRIFDRVEIWKTGIGSELDRLEGQVNDVLGALRAQWDYTAIQGIVESTDLARLLQACTQQERSVQRHKVQVVEQFAGLRPVPVQKVKLMRVIFCLLENAVDSIVKAEPPEGGFLYLRLRSKDGQAIVEIEDNGTGLPNGLGDQIFSQGFSTKQSSSGFGLHNCANAIMEMGGSLELVDNQGRPGATARIALPLEPQSASPSKSENQ